VGWKERGRRKPEGESLLQKKEKKSAGRARAKKPIEQCDKTLNMETTKDKRDIICRNTMVTILTSAWGEREQNKERTDFTSKPFREKKSGRLKRRYGDRKVRN